MFIYFVTIHFKAKAAVPVFFAGFAFLSGYHIKRMYENYGGYDMDLTLILMQQLIRVTYFAWSIRDMHSEPSKLPESSVGRVLKRTPTLIEFLGYNFNFLGMLCPSYDIFDYIEFIEEEGNYAVIPVKKEDHLRVVYYILGAIVYFLACSMFTYMPADVVTDAVIQKPFVVRVVIYNIAATAFRSRYYVPWMLSQLVIDLAGISYNKSKDTFDKYEGARPLDVEWTYWDAKRRVTVWNMGTQRWLKSCFFERFERKLGKSNAALGRLLLIQLLSCSVLSGTVSTSPTISLSSCSICASKFKR